MLRVIFYLLCSIFLITIVRSVIGVIMKGLGEAMSSSTPPVASAKNANVPLTGEFKKDPVCGTYISTATQMQKTAGGQTYYFCSEQCRDKFAARA